MSDPRSQRFAALEQLRQNRMKAGSTASSVTSDSRGESAQVADLVTSRYFPSNGTASTSADLGTVLVADSSPASTPSSRANSYQPHLTHGVPSRAGWLSMQDNILSAPSNFISANSSTSSLASTSRMAYAQPRRKPDDHDKDQERPRKKVNTGSNHSVLVPDSSPLSTSSKASVRPPFHALSSSSQSISQAREQLSTIRIASNGASSDDSSPDSLLLQDDRPRGRLIRGKHQLSVSPEKGDVSQPIILGSSPPESSLISSLTGATSKQKTNGTQPKFVSRNLDDDDVQVLPSSPTSSPAVRRVVGGASARAGTSKPPASPNLDLSKFSHQPRKVNMKSAIYAKRLAVEQPQDEVEVSDQPPSRGSKRKLRGAISDSGSDGEFKSQGLKIAKPRVNLDSDESEMDTEDEDEPAADDVEEARRDEEGVKWFNEASENSLIELTSCTPAQAKTIAALRPFDNHNDLRSKLNKRKGVSYKLFEIYREVMQGYDALDVLLKKCERFGEKVTKAMSQWGGTAAPSLQPSKAGTPSPDAMKNGDGGVNGTKGDDSTAPVESSGPQLSDIKVVVDPPADSTSATNSNTKPEDDKSQAAETTKTPKLDASLSLDVKPTNPKSMDVDEPSGASTPTGEEVGVHITEIKIKPGLEVEDLNGYIPTQPALLSKEVQLKDYQLTGINWLNLLWTKHMSAILADEMGLGKTVQVIAFLAHLKESRVDEHYRHLVIVPASTLENWVREFERFAPDMSVQTYYGAQNERSELRYQLLANRSWDVLVTTYNLAQGSELDRKFFKKIDWEVCVFDEGHVLKNYNSQRYTHLMAIRASWRLLLTGTPLQNNLQELVSLLNFIMPSLFKEHEESLRAIFKTKADSTISFLSRNRISRAKKMMTPFVLRRRKDQVLKDLPRKKEWIEYCEMTTLQRTIYREALQRSRKTIQSIPEDELSQPLESKPKPKPKPKKKSKIGASNGDTSSNVLMDLRKASSHPMLFRRLFSDAKIKIMAKDCMKEPEFCDSNYSYVVEDMEVMTDAELQKFCKRYKSVNKHALDDSAFLEAGKIKVLLGLLENYKAQNKRVLIFSQFTQILDILESIFTHLDIQYLILTGSTAVDERQGLVDIFNEDEEISVFLLSTKAGGMGINLTAACVVIIFDQDFNPHNDKQACDRAYRIGQKRDVDVIKLVTKGTIEEDMYNLGNTKLMLDQAVATDRGDDEGESAPEKAMKASLLSVLKRKFEKEEGDGENEPDLSGDVLMTGTGLDPSDKATTGNDDS